MSYRVSLERTVHRRDYIEIRREYRDEHGDLVVEVEKRRRYDDDLASPPTTEPAPPLITDPEPTPDSVSATSDDPGQSQSTDQPSPSMSPLEVEESGDSHERLVFVTAEDRESTPPVTEFLVLDSIDGSDEEVDVYLDTTASDLDEDEDDGEQWVDAPEYPLSSSSRRSRTARCTACGEVVTQRLRRHIEQQHVPWWLSPTRACWTCHGTAQCATFASQRHHGQCAQVAMKDVNIPTYISLCNGLLSTICRDLGCSTYDDLLQLVRERGWHPNARRRPQLSLQQKLHMWLWERESNRSFTPFADLQIAPPTSVSALLHYKVVAAILPHLTDDAQQTVRAGKEKDAHGVRVAALVRLVHTVDAHMHLDRYPLGDLKAYTGAREESAVRYQYLVPSFAFPDSWRDVKVWTQLDSRIYFAAGIHPSRCFHQRLRPEELMDLIRISEHPRCVAYGEIGLDYVRGGPRTIAMQKRNLQTLLESRPRHLPVVLHCRGNDSLTDTLALLDNTYGLSGILIHSFQGTSMDRELVLQKYPRSLFSISPLCLKEGLSEEFSAAVRGMTLEQIVLETDAPYLTTHPRRDLYRIAAWIGQQKGCCASIVLEACRRNAITFYRLPVSATKGF